MANKVLKSKEIEFLEKKGIDPFSDIPISYRFVVSVSTKRLEFFEMFYNRITKKSIT